MDLARNALLAIVVGVVLIGLAGGLVPHQEPRECSTNVEPAEDAATEDATILQYSDLSPQGQSVFDRARSQQGSVTVTGSDCPEDFEYTAGQERYVVETGEDRYLVETYQTDLIPQDGIAIASLVLLALTVTAIGVASHDRDDSRVPLAAAGAGAVGGATTVVSLTILDALVWYATGLSLLTAAGLLVAAGLTYKGRRSALVAAAGVLTGPLAAVFGVKSIAAFGAGVVSVGAPVLVGIAFAVQYFR